MLYKLPMKILISSLLLSSAAANAHVSVSSGIGYANSYYQVDLSVPHGCDGFDTYKVEVDLPDSVSAVAPILNYTSNDSTVTVETNATTGNTEKLIFTRSTTVESDQNIYKLSFRAKLPDTSFTTIYFPTTQYCKDADDNELTSAWVGTGSHDSHDSTDETAELPAPSLMVYPTRQAGWNKYTAPDHLHDLSIFDDAEIVWVDGAAYSANTITQELIANDADSTVLTEIHPDQEIWVKY